MTSRRVLIGSLIGCTGLIVVGLLFIIALAIGTDIGMQKAKQQEAVVEGETTNTPKTQRGEEYIPVVMRVSGEQGTRYRCNHSDIAEGGEGVQEEERGVLGSSPVEYRARARGETEGRPPSEFYGSCSIDDSERRGQLKLELLVNGRIVDSHETRPDPPGQKSWAGFSAEVSYSPSEGGPNPTKAKFRE